MPLKQGLGKCRDAIDEVLFALAVVVDMYLDIGNALPCKTCQVVDNIGAILFLRVEDAVLRRLPTAIAKSRGNLGQSRHPARDTFTRQLFRRPSPKRRVM